MAENSSGDARKILYSNIKVGGAAHHHINKMLTVRAKKGTGQISRIHAIITLDATDSGIGWLHGIGPGSQFKKMA